MARAEDLHDAVVVDRGDDEVGGAVDVLGLGRNHAIQRLAHQVRAHVLVDGLRVGRGHLGPPFSSGSRSISAASAVAAASRHSGLASTSYVASSYASASGR